MDGNVLITSTVGTSSLVQGASGLRTHGVRTGGKDSRMPCGEGICPLVFGAQGRAGRYLVELGGASYLA